MKETIAIAGCGWLGFPLARNLLSAGYTIHGSTTSPEKMGQLHNAGIIPFLIALKEDGISGNMTDFLKDAEIVVVNVPPGLRGTKHTEDYVQKMNRLQEAISKSGVRKLIFISSTAVYGDLEGEVTEATEPKPVTESGKQVLAAEMIFRDAPGLDSTVIRFGGLIGPDRHPVTHLAGRKGLKNGGEPVNLIHLDDCIGMIRSILESSYWNETFIGVFPYHPTKRQYYLSEAAKRRLPAPEYEVENKEIIGKTLKSKNFINKKYSFLTPISDEFTTEK